MNQEKEPTPRRKVPDDIQAYARAFLEWHLRIGGYRAFSHRQKFDGMTKDEVGDELDRLKIQVIEKYATPEPAS